VSGTTTQFLYDRWNRAPGTRSRPVTVDYSAGAEKLSGTIYWMLQDGQGSTRQLLNSSQATVASYTTDAFGNSVASSGSAANPFQWNGGSGYYSDSESGLQKVGARYYEPATGRWISQDSLLFAGSVADSQAVNRYLYCGANPVAHYDSGGHEDGTPLILLGIAIVVAGVLGIFEAAIMALLSLIGAAVVLAVTVAMSVAAYFGSFLIRVGMDMNYRQSYPKNHAGQPAPPPQDITVSPPVPPIPSGSSKD
jgi:RHS repeat-associated protein